MHENTADFCTNWEFTEQLALLTITNYKLQITNGYITEGVF